MEPLTRSWAVKYTHAAICMALRGEALITVINALTIIGQEDSGFRGSNRRRDAVLARQRLVAGLPGSSAEVIFPRREAIVIMEALEFVINRHEAEHALFNLMDAQNVVHTAMLRSADARKRPQEVAR